MRTFLTRRLALLAAAHFTIDSYSSFFSPLLPLLAVRLDLNLTMVGGLVALSSLSSSLSQPLFGWLSDRLTRPWFVAAGPLVAGLFLSAIGLASSFWALLGLLVLGGLGVSAFHPQAAALAGGSTPRRALGMSFFITGGTLGFAVGPLFAVGVVDRLGLERTWVAVLPGLVAGLVLLVALARIERPAHARGPRPALRELRPVLRPLTLLYFAVVCRSAVASGFTTFLPLYLHGRGYAVATGGWVLALYLGLGALGGFLGGWMAERIGGRRVVIQSFLGGIPLFVAFLLLPDVPGLVCLVLGSFVLQGSLPVNVVLGQELSPRHSSTISSLLMGAAWGVGALLISPAGVLADRYGLRAALAALTGLLFAGLLCALALPSPHERAGPAEPAHPGAVGA